MSPTTTQVNRKKNFGNHKVSDKGLFLASIKVAFGTSLSRIFGLARDITIATLFGATPAADAFFVAFKIPNFFRRMFAEGSFTQGFIPVLGEYKTQASTEETQALIARVTGALGAFLLLFTAIGMAFSSWIVLVVAPGFWEHPEQQQLAGSMLRITFPYLLLVSLTALAAGVLNTYQSFAMPALTPIWLNLCMITAAFVLAPRLDTPIHALAWGVLAAGVVQLLFLFPSLKAKQMLLLPQFRPKDPGVKRVVNLMIPAMFGAAVGQINVVIDLVLASFLMAGSISWLYYSDRLMELPLGLFGVGIATVILPSLSADRSMKDTLSFRQTLDWAMRVIFLVGAPASIALILLSEALLTTLFQYGSTTAFDVRMASLSLDAYAIGLLGLMLAKVLAAGFFSAQDTKTPVRIGLIAVATNIILSLVLINWLAHAGLALATSVAALLNATLLYAGLIRAGRLQLESRWLWFLARLGIALLTMSLVLVYLCPDVETWLATGVLARVLTLIMLCFIGALVYGLTLLLLGFQLKELRRS